MPTLHTRRGLCAYLEYRAQLLHECAEMSPMSIRCVELSWVWTFRCRWIDLGLGITSAG